MKEVIIKLKAIETINFNPQKFESRMNIKYNIDGENFERLVVFDLTAKAEGIVARILKFLKSQAEQDTDEDDLIESLFVKKLVDEEKIEERLLNYFGRLCEKIRFIRRDKNHADYMKLYDEIRMSKISLN